MKCAVVNCSKTNQGNGANIEADDTPDLEAPGKPLTGTILTNIKINNDMTQSYENDMEDLPNDGLENFACFICHKLKDVVPDIAVTRNAEAFSYTWVYHLSEGGLSKPTQAMMMFIKELEAIFAAINGESLLITKDFLKIHQQQSEHINYNEKIKKLFFRARMYLKIRQLNQEISENAKSQKRKWNKTVN